MREISNVAGLNNPYSFVPVTIWDSAFSFS